MTDLRHPLYGAASAEMATRVAATPMHRMDVPTAVVEAEAREIWAERDRRVAALNFRQAAQRTHSPSDRIAFYLDARLIREQAPVSVDADYPGWAEHIAALQAANTAHKEA